MKFYILFLLSLIGCCSDAANVLWNCVTQNYGAGNEIGISYEIDTMFMFDLVFSVEQNASACQVVVQSVSLGASENILAAQPGDVANEHTTRHLPATDYYLHSYIDDEDCYGTLFLDVDKGSDFYWMFAVSDDIINFVNPRYVYGWVNVGVDGHGNLSVLGSALDLDGGPMIVGGGSAIPEPSSVLLLLIGVASISLRRRARIGGAGCVAR